MNEWIMIGCDSSLNLFSFSILDSLKWKKKIQNEKSERNCPKKESKCWKWIKKTFPAESDKTNFFWKMREKKISKPENENMWWNGKKRRMMMVNDDELMANSFHFFFLIFNLITHTLTVWNGEKWFQKQIDLFFLLPKTFKSDWNVIRKKKEI